MLQDESYGEKCLVRMTCLGTWIYANQSIFKFRNYQLDSASPCGLFLCCSFHSSFYIHHNTVFIEAHTVWCTLPSRPLSSDSLSSSVFCKAGTPGPLKIRRVTFLHALSKKSRVQQFGLKMQYYFSEAFIKKKSSQTELFLVAKKKEKGEAFGFLSSPCSPPLAPGKLKMWSSPAAHPQSNYCWKIYIERRFLLLLALPLTLALPNRDALAVCGSALGKPCKGFGDTREERKWV